LGSDRFTWGDLLALVQNRRHDSALSRALDPDWQWRALEPNLLAFMSDRLAWLQWSKTKDASAKPPRNVPKPMPRPGIKGYDKDPDVLRLSVDEVKRRLALPRRALAVAA